MNNLEWSGFELKSTPLHSKKITGVDLSQVTHTTSPIRFIRLWKGVLEY